MLYAGAARYDLGNKQEYSWPKAWPLQRNQAGIKKTHWAGYWMLDNSACPFAGLAVGKACGKEKPACPQGFDPSEHYTHVGTGKQAEYTLSGDLFLPKGFQIFREASRRVELIMCFFTGGVLLSSERSAFVYIQNSL